MNRGPDVNRPHDRVRESRHHGQPAVLLQAPDGARATVLLHGAHLSSWQPTPGDERLYLSGTSRYGPGEAVRGGVPVIFPRFALGACNAEVPRHGFVRTRAWRLVPRAPAGAASPPPGRSHAPEPGCANEPGPACEPDAGAEARVVLELVDDDETRAMWPRRFALRLGVALSGERLTLALCVHNTGDEPFDFSAALHTYFSVSDIASVRVTGLEGLAFDDKVAGRRDVERSPALRFQTETDRVYERVRETIVLHDGQRVLRIDQRGFEDAVIWNPWAERCAALPDMPADDYRRMVCIEAAQVMRPVTLPAGGHWEGVQTLSIPATA
ncbi:MAG: D-hexose-6-phosphate mutarotase [Lautropia sp.]